MLEVLTAFKATLALLAASSSTTMQREFRFVPYGESFVAEDGRPTVSCDGRVPGGVTLELTHWTDNETPDNLYADTSTEIALNFAKKQPATLQDALILNNHYDTDGVTSVWACLEPKAALEYSSLLIQGAEAGDFGEWSSDAGVKLDCTLCSMLRQHASEEEAYKNALQELPRLLQDLQENGGMSYQDLWKDGWEHANQGYTDLQQGKATVEAVEESNGKLVIVSESTSSPLSPYALHRGLKEYGLWSDAIRILRVSANQHFEYEKAGHGWVQKLVQRHTVPTVDAGKLVQQLNSEFENTWKTGGSSGLVAICQTKQPLKDSPQEVAHALVDLDPGFQA